MHIKEGEGGRRESTEGGTFFFPRKSMLGHMVLRSGCWIWPLETVLDGPYLMQCVRDEHDMGWPGRKRVIVALEKFCHGG